MKILHLTIKKKWFDMIASGEKKEEYRTIKKHWDTRLLGKDYDHVLFVNGYKKDSPKVMLTYKGFHIGIGQQRWGAPELECVYVIKLGEIIVGYQ